jgi:hypothetical protein
MADITDIKHEGKHATAGDSQPPPTCESFGRYHAVEFHKGKADHKDDQEQEVKGGAEVHEEREGGKNQESADDSFQAGLLSADNLFMRHPEAPLPLLIVND